MKTYIPRKADFITVTFDPQSGHEQKGRRPALVVSNTLFNKHDEEAKAYAFELAWLKILKEHNVANLAEAINLGQPAENGLHDVAFKFVQDMMKKGRQAIEVFHQLVNKEISFASPDFS